MVSTIDTLIIWQHSSLPRALGANTKKTGCEGSTENVPLCVYEYGKIYLPMLKQEAEAEAEAREGTEAVSADVAAAAKAAARQTVAVKFIWLVMRFNCLSLG